MSKLSIAHAHECSLVRALWHGLDDTVSVESFGMTIWLLLH